LPKINEVKMNLVAILLMAAASAPKDFDAEHQPYIALNHEWLRIHKTAERAGSPADACLVLDPTKEAVWIERDGKIDLRNRQPLPAGLDWLAFIVTPEGVAQVPFPVRLNRPRPDPQDEQNAETIWIVGSSKEQSWQFNVSAGPGGHMFHVGSGSPISSIKIPIPRLKETARKAPPQDSILVSPNSQRKWVDSIRNRWITVDVVPSAPAPCQSGG
jgi:hypothetical protein